MLVAKVVFAVCLLCSQVACFFCMTAVHWFICNSKVKYQCFQVLFKSIMCKLPVKCMQLFFKIQILGKHEVISKGKNCILVCNHVSLVDSLLVGSVVPWHYHVRFLCRQDQIRMPILGSMLQMLQFPSIDFLEGNKAIGSTVASAMQQCKDWIAVQDDGHPKMPVIFAEGLQNFQTGTLLPFKKGAFELAMQTGVPIVPCVLKNTTWLLEQTAKAKGCVALQVLNREYTGMTSVEQVMQECYQDMNATFKQD